MKAGRYIENSLFAHWLRNVAVGSLFIEFWQALEKACRKTGHNAVRFCRSSFQGSRIISFFIVGDYLSQPKDNLLAPARLSKSFQWVARVFLPAARQLKKTESPGSMRESLFSSFIFKSWIERLRVSSRKEIMIFILIFVAAFFGGRFLLLYFYPQAVIYTPWSAGLLLFAALVWLIFQVRQPDKITVEKSRGIVESLIYLAGFFLNAIRLLSKHIITMAFRLFTRRTPPVEGGD
jgi:hypothetical protein